MAKKPVITTPSPNLIGVPNVSFNKDSFDAAIWNKGYDVIVEQAIRCPHDYTDNQATITCQNCLGLGWVFVNPKLTKAIITSINTETKTKQWSEEKLGTVQVTTRDIDRFGYMDRVTLKNSSTVNNSCLYSEVLTVRNNGTNKFVFLSYSPTEIKGVFTHNGDNVALVKLPSNLYSISSNNGYVLELSYNFTQLSGWNGVISILYEHESQYHIMDIPHDIRNSYIKNNDGKGEQIILPVQGIARRTHNVFDMASYDGSGLIDNSWIS